MKVLFFILLSLSLVNCFRKTEVECGCEDRGREAVEVMASVSGDGSSVLDDILREVDIENRDIYGVCLISRSIDRSDIIFCADSEREYRDISDRNSNVSFRITRRISR